MEIVVISHKYPPSIGGMQTHCYELVKALEKSHKVHQVIFKNNYPKVIFMLTAAIRALNVIRKHKTVEVVYTNDALMALFCVPLLWWSSVPMTVTIHGLDITFPLRFYQRWILKFLNRYDRLITISGPTTNLALSKGFDPKRVVKVENAVDINNAHAKENPRFREELSKELGIDLTGKCIITSLGRAIPRKGFSWFTREVAPYLPDDCVCFIIARNSQNPGLYRFLQKVLPAKVFETIRLVASAETDDEAITRAIKDLKLEKKVFRLTQYTKSRERILEVLMHSDLFVMPNLHIPGDYEGFGLVALEAASHGALTLAANTDGIPSAIVDGETGYLIEPGNPQAWIERIRYFHDNPEIRRQKAREFQQATTAHSRSWQTMADKYVEVFMGIEKKK